MSRENIGPEIYANPDNLLRTATQLGKERAPQAPEIYPAGLFAYLPHAPLEHHISKRLANDHSTGKVFAQLIEDTDNPGQLTTTIDTLGQWLSSCDNGLTLDSSYRDNSKLPRVPCKDIRHALFDKIIESGWTQNIDTIDSISESLASLMRHSRDRRDALGSFIYGMPAYVRNLLRSARDGDPATPPTIALLSSLTDKGVVPESLWGTEAISKFDENAPDEYTPFALTEELYRRFVIEKRDSYSPESIKARLDVIAKYSYALLKRVTDDETRHQGSTEIISRRLRLTDSIPQNWQLKPLIDLANDITQQANKHGGIPNAEGNFVTCEPLPARRVEVMGEALQRILYATRTRNAGPELRQQQYTDSIHAEIVHELSTMHGNLPHALGIVGMATSEASAD